MVCRHFFSSAIIVNELHTKPLQQKMWVAVRSETNGHEELVELVKPISTDRIHIDTGIAVSSAYYGDVNP